MYNSYTEQGNENQRQSHIIFIPLNKGISIGVAAYRAGTAIAAPLFGLSANCRPTFSNKLIKNVVTLEQRLAAPVEYFWSLFQFVQIRRYVVV